MKQKTKLHNERQQNVDKSWGYCLGISNWPSKSFLCLFSLN